MDALISPEINNDELSNDIKNIIINNNINIILEIGSSSGEGSTKSIVDSIIESKREEKSHVYCIEPSKVRFEKLCYNYYQYNNIPYRIDGNFINPYNYISGDLRDYVNDEYIKYFYENYNTNLNNYSLEQVLNWKKEEIDYIKKEKIPMYGIETIKQHNNIHKFDLVLLDGSAFTGEYDFGQIIYRTDWIILDDILDIKNYYIDELLNDINYYELYKRNLTLRNGYSIWRKK